MSILPFKYKSCRKWSNSSNLYTSVEFIKDFGVFKKGETYIDIMYNFEEGFIEHLYLEQDIHKRQEFSITI